MEEEKEKWRWREDAMEVIEDNVLKGCREGEERAIRRKYSNSGGYEKVLM